MKNSKKNYGVTLIALVITILVLLILAGVTIATFTDESGILTQTQTAKIATELTGIKEKIETEEISKNNENKTLRYMTVKEVNEKIKDIPENYKGKIGLYRGEIIYLGNEEDNMASIAQKYGYRILNMTENEFSYYIELGILEDTVLENKEKKIGRELATAEFEGTIEIQGNTYSNGWYLIGNYTEEEENNNTYGNQFEKLGIKDTTHAPYLVNYETGSIFSIHGMEMYQSKIRVHTFQDNNFKLINAITYVGDGSIKNGNYYGNLYSTALYNGLIEDDSIYSDNNRELEYDEQGALILDGNNAIPVLSVNNKYKIDDEYSINITLNGAIHQQGDELYLASIVSLSDNTNEFIGAIGVYDGYLHIYTYKNNAQNSHPYLREELIEKGFASIDISKYENQTINVQVIAKRSKETKVYINGEIILTFESGDEVFTYNYLTIGDLRVGRNLKFTGKIYNFAIYGVALTDNEVQQNYEEAKKYGIN